MALSGEGSNGTTVSSSPERGQLQLQEETVAVGDQKPFKGIRMRRWGRWVSEIRIPKSRTRIWLGSYDTPEKAARAYDAASYCLHGGRGRFNFPDEERPGLPEELRLALSKSDIKAIAARFALSSSSSSSSSPVGSPRCSSAAARCSEDTELQERCKACHAGPTKCDDVNQSMDEDCGSPFDFDDLLLRGPSMSDITSIWDLL